MATQPHPIYGDVNLGNMFSRGFNFLTDNVIDPFAEAIRQSTAKRQGIFTGTANAGGMPPAQQPVLTQPTPNPHPPAQAPILSNITGPLPRPENLGVQYRDMGHVEQFNAPPREVNIATPLPRPTLAERQQSGALTDPTNRRDNTILATPKIERPDLRIGMNDMLMSIGGRGLRDLNKGSSAALGGMFDQFDRIGEVNRSAALQDYELAVAEKKAEQDAKLAQQKQEDLRKYREEYLKIKAQEKAKTGTGKTSKQDADTVQAVANYDQAITKMEMALGDLKSGMQLTGLFDGTIGALIDRVQGNPEATSRLLLQELKVDSSLIQISQTKGAISNKEMELFLSPTPNIKLDDEQTWINWIERRMSLAKTVRNRLLSGETVDDPATVAQVNQFTGGQPTASATASSPQGDIALAPDDQAILDKY